MKAHALFRHLSPELAGEVFAHAQTAEKPAYKLAVQTLAAQFKLRPVFVEQKPRPERYAWLQRAMSRPPAEMIAANFLQMWLVGSQRPMLCDFLESQGISHDGKGGVDAMPPAPEPDAIRRAVDTLLEKYPAEAVAVYLRCFLAMESPVPAGWEVLRETVATNPRLRMGTEETSSPDPTASTDSPASPPAHAAASAPQSPSTGSAASPAGAPPAAAPTPAKTASPSAPEDVPGSPKA